ncbi:MAG: sulfite exporter TauE/SafE family protein, partial [Synergistaceae bacterium]|nr:sulfite exporter TauE/SafE family protein [Synergistaceae bacterium]
MRKQIHIAISGMTCTNCRDRITRKLKKTPGIIQASVSYEDSSAEIIYDSGRISFQQIADIINQLGYRISSRSSQLTRRIFILASIATLYAFLQSSGVLNFLVPGQLADSRMSYGMLLVIGLTTSVHCVAMCGGINLSQTISDLRSFYPALAYNFGRVMSYTVTGGLLGLAGFLANGAGKFEVSLFLQSVLKVAAGVFMLVMGANMLNIFPALRRLSLRLPKFLSDKIILAGIGRKSPLIVGLLNGLMPCGPLQSMWLVALASSNPLSGALSMMMFAMGTVPLMLGLGTIVSAAGKKFSACVKTSGAVLVTVMGLIMITQGGSLG